MMAGFPQIMLVIIQNNRAVYYFASFAAQKPISE